MLHIKGLKTCLFWIDESNCSLFIFLVFTWAYVKRRRERASEWEWECVCVCVCVCVRERERERARECVREKHGQVASYTYPYLGFNLQPRYVPWLGIEPTILVHRTTLQPTKPPSQGCSFVLFCFVFKATLSSKLYCSTEMEPGL